MSKLLSEMKKLEAVLDRIAKTHKLEVLVLEERPTGADHPQATRMLRGVEFNSRGLMKIEGQPRYDEFPVQLKLLGKPEQNTARVVKVEPKHFWIQLQQPSKDLAWFK